MFSSRTSWNLHPNRFTAALERFRSSGRELLDLTLSNPTAARLQFDEASILAALAHPAALQYHPEALGLRAARKAVASYYAARGSASTVVDPDRILLTTSTSEAYSYLFRLLCDPGDQVLVPAPSYPLFQFLADLNDLRLVSYSLLYDHGWQVDLNALEKGLTSRTRAVIVVHPNNPTGSFVRDEEIQALACHCASRDVALIADEVFLDYAHDGHPRSSFAAQSGVLTFTLSGLSKIAGLPQMKLAWMVVSGPEEQAARALERLELIADTYLSQNAPIQLALPALLEQRHGIQTQLSHRIRRNLSALDSQLAGSACRRLELEGGWYAVLRVPVTRSDEDLAIALLEEHAVLVHPGHFYDFPQDGYLVVSLIVPEERFGEGINRLMAGLGAA